MDVSGSKVTVLGAGASGRSAARWAVSGGAAVSVSDLKPLEDWPQDFVDWCMKNHVFIEAGHQDEKTCLSSDLIIASPGIPYDIPALKAARNAGVPVLGELALAASMWRGPMIAITGTNGKTTTTSLVGEMFRNAGVPYRVAGNIGEPLLNLILEGASEEVAILEMSSFQLDYFPLGETFFNEPRFAAAAILNLAPDHMDRYQDLHAYGHSKARLLDMQGEGGWSILNGADANLAPFIERGAGGRLFFGFDDMGRNGAVIEADKGLIRVNLLESIKNSGEEIYHTSSWALKGRHNLENLAAAVLLARVSGVGPAAVQAAIATFKAPSHRIEWVAARGGINYYDDSKGTNVGSVIKAIESMEAPVVLIAGGRGKGESYGPLRDALILGGVKALVLMGEEASAIRRELKGAVPMYEVSETSDGRRAMKEAVEIASSRAQKGDAVLLSPACASFDMFVDYKERGAVFKEAVLGLADTEA